MNKKTLPGLSAILFVGTITFTCSYVVGPYVIRALHNSGSSVLRADDPLPPFPPQGLSSPSDVRADDPLPPFPWGLPSSSGARVS
jgi:hypothetical protein